MAVLTEDDVRNLTYSAHALCENNGAMSDYQFRGFALLLLIDIWTARNTPTIVLEEV